MGYIYGVVGARLFLEPPHETDEGVVFFNLANVEIPENFVREAERELWRHPPEDENFTPEPDAEPEPLLGRLHPEVELIGRMEHPVERRAFFARKAKSLWDVCDTVFDVENARGLCVSLLVEYEVHRLAMIEEGDTRFLFLDCKRRFVSALAEYKAAHKNWSEGEAVGEAWALTAREMRMVYGLPEERVVEIIREGTRRWKEDVLWPGARLSFAHIPRFYFVASPPWRRRRLVRVG